MTEPRYQFRYLRLGDVPADFDDGVLYCDPLTSLVAYPSFEAYVIDMLPRFAAEGLHLAIGDVDGLREYVTERRSCDPSSFGHLAGNRCMRIIGQLTASWAAAELVNSTFHVCGTFGGDEVIVAASALGHQGFLCKVQRLCQTIKASAPRPCSFALATLKDSTVAPRAGAEAYRRVVSMIDARLFDEKERSRRNGNHLNGSVADLGFVNLLNGAHPAIGHETEAKCE